MNESAKKKKDSIEIKKVSINNKNDYLSTHVNSIYHKPTENYNSKTRKIKENYKDEK